MAKNPIGPDGAPMERHHPGRLSGPTELISQTEHYLIHAAERDAVRTIFRMDGFIGNPGAWSGKRIKSGS